MAEDNILREVDEDLRSERMRNLWRRVAPFVIGGAVAVVALVAVNEGWTWYHTNNAASSSQELYAAFDLIDGGDLAAAQTQLDALEANGSGNYPMLAQFRKAGILARQGNVTEAVAAYDALANSQSNPRLRELALILAGNLLVDTGSLAEVEARVSTLTTEDSPLRNAARETLGLAQYRAGDFDAANASFQAVLDDPLAQNDTRTRMAIYQAQMLAQGNVAAEQTTTAEDAATAIDEIVSGADEPAAEAPSDETPPAETPAPATP